VENLKGSGLSPEKKIILGPSTANGPSHGKKHHESGFTM
jgi:hypothetical protein